MPLGANKAAIMGVAGVSTGDVVLLSTQIGTGVDDITFSSKITSTYGEYIFRFYNLNPETNGDEFAFQVNATDGAEPSAQSTELGQLTVCEPPLVKINVNEQARPDADGFEKVNVFVLVSTVAVTTLPAVTSISCVPPPVPPIAFTVSA